jgi:hypothetical protein
MAEPKTRDEGLGRAARRALERDERRAQRRDAWAQTDAILDDHAARRRARDLPADTPRHGNEEPPTQENTSPLR